MASRVVLMIQFTPDPAWALVLVTVTLVIATFILAKYGRSQAIEAAKLRSEYAKLLLSAERDRKFKLIDSRLQNAVYPIYEILRNSKFGAPRRAGEGNMLLYRDEKMKIGNIVTKYGYYLDPNLLRSVREQITESTQTCVRDDGVVHIFKEGPKLIKLYDMLRNSVENLTKQLRDLTD